MKRLFAVLLVAIVAFGCENSTNDEFNLDEYYVKYEAIGSSIYYDSKLIEVTINNEYGNKMIFDPGRSFEIIIGPVKKGFNATLDINVISSAPTKLYLKISVNKNDGPFALKGINGSDQNRESAQLSYIIDF